LFAFARLERHAGHLRRRGVEALKQHFLESPLGAPGSRTVGINQAHARRRTYSLDMRHFADPYQVKKSFRNHHISIE